MINRVMEGSVTVMGFPALIWSIHKGMTLPREHITLPYRVQQIFVLPDIRDLAMATFSSMAFVMPMELMG